jgi:hypothetical protein
VNVHEKEQMFMNASQISANVHGTMSYCYLNLTLKWRNTTSSTTNFVLNKFNFIKLYRLKDIMESENKELLKDTGQLYKLAKETQEICNSYANI